MAEPTQMLVLSIPASKPIEDPTSPAGTTWQEILELIRKSEGYKRLYWGRHVEKPDHVQLHIGRAFSLPHAMPSHYITSSTFLYPCPQISHYLLDTSLPRIKSQKTSNTQQSAVTSHTTTPSSPPPPLTSQPSCTPSSPTPSQQSFTLSSQSIQSHVRV